MEPTQTVTFAEAAAALGQGILWVVQNIFMGFYNIGYAVSHPSLWLDWSDNQAIMRFVYYGGSVELFFAFFAILLTFTMIGVWKRELLWGAVRGIEGFGNTLGRIVAWAGLIMVLQQVLIVIMQRIFTRADIVLGIGIPLQFDISWYAEGLKFYNALIVCLCVAYTFIQGGHVRVDLFYTPASFKRKKIIDMFGSLVFMIPAMVVTWMYSWYFLWRHLIVPKPSASDQLDRLLMKSRALKWNVETIGPSPNGFTAYFLFKVLLVLFAGTVILQAVGFFYRSLLEYLEGEESHNKYLDKDTLGDGEEAYEGTH